MHSLHLSKLYQNLSANHHPKQFGQPHTLGKSQRSSINSKSAEVNMESALMMMSHLTIADKQYLESKFQSIQDPQYSTLRNLSNKLSEKLRPYPLAERIDIAGRYVDYTAQARTLELDADEWEVETAVHLRQMALRNVPVLTGFREYDEFLQKEEQPVNWVEMQLDEDLVRLRKNTATLRAMQSICLDRIWFIETGDANDIREMIEYDDWIAEEVRKCNVDEVFAQEDVSEIWEHENNADRIFRLRLISVMEKEKRDTELQRARERQMADLMNGVEAMGFSEPETVKEAREKAIEVSKKELNDLLAEMCNLNLQRREVFTQIPPKIFLRIADGRIWGSQASGP